MATRSELILKAIGEQYKSKKKGKKVREGEKPFYLQKPFWDVVFGVLGVGADVLDVYTPGPAKVIKTVVRSAQREVKPVEEINEALNAKKQLLTTQLQASTDAEQEISEARLRELIEIQRMLGSNAEEESN